MLTAIGVDRANVYIANVMPWRPPGNRTPTPQETEICRPFIERQIELADPKVLVALAGLRPRPDRHTGGHHEAARQLARPSHAVRQGNPVMPTLHPAYLLRQPPHKRLAWRDFLEIKARLRRPITRQRLPCGRGRGRCQADARAR